MKLSRRNFRFLLFAYARWRNGYVHSSYRKDVNSNRSMRKHLRKWREQGTLGSEVKKGVSLRKRPAAAMPQNSFDASGSQSPKRRHLRKDSTQKRPAAEVYQEWRQCPVSVCSLPRKKIYSFTFVRRSVHIQPMSRCVSFLTSVSPTTSTTSATSKRHQAVQPIQPLIPVLPPTDQPPNRPTNQRKPTRTNANQRTNGRVPSSKQAR